MSNLLERVYAEETVALLQDIEMMCRDERDKIQGILDHQADNPDDQVDPDEYLEGSVKTLDWLMVNLQARIKEL